MDKKRIGTITIERLDSKENPLSVSFWGFNEGCAFPCSNEKEVKKQVDYLLKRYSMYALKILDERERQRTLC